MLRVSSHLAVLILLKNLPKSLLVSLLVERGPVLTLRHLNTKLNPTTLPSTLVHLVQKSLVLNSLQMVSLKTRSQVDGGKLVQLATADPLVLTPKTHSRIVKCLKVNRKVDGAKLVQNSLVLSSLQMVSLKTRSQVDGGKLVRLATADPLVLRHKTHSRIAKCLKVNRKVDGAKLVQQEDLLVLSLKTLRKTNQTISIKDRKVAQDLNVQINPAQTLKCRLAVDGVTPRVLPTVVQPIAPHLNQTLK